MSEQPSRGSHHAASSIQGVVRFASLSLAPLSRLALLFTPHTPSKSNVRARRVPHRQLTGTPGASSSIFAPACDAAHSSGCSPFECLSRQRSGKHRDHKRASLSAGRNRERRIRYAPCKRCAVCVWSACTRHILSRLANLLEDVLVSSSATCHTTRQSREKSHLSEACKKICTQVYVRALDGRFHKLERSCVQRSRRIVLSSRAGKRSLFHALRERRTRRSRALVPAVTSVSPLAPRRCSSVKLYGRVTV